MRKYLIRFGRNNDGSMAIEFGVVAPLLLMLLFGIMEFSMILFLNATLEGSIREAARFGMTGTVPPGKTREDLVVEKVRTATMGLVPIDTSNVTFKVYETFGGIGQPEPYTDDSPANGQYDLGETYTDTNSNGQWDADKGVPGLGVDCDIVVYRVKARWRLMFGMLASTIGQDFYISASAAVRNEPFNNAPC